MTQTAKDLEASNMSMTRKDFEILIKNAWFDNGYINRCVGWKHSDTYQSLITKNEVKP